MNIRIEAVNYETEERRVLGSCMTDSPSRAMQLYTDKLTEEEGLEWDYINTTEVKR